MNSFDRDFLQRAANLHSNFHPCYNADGFVPYQAGCWVDNVGEPRSLAFWQMLEFNNVLTNDLIDIIMDVVVETDELIFRISENKGEM